MSSTGFVIIIKIIIIVNLIIIIAIVIIIIAIIRKFKSEKRDLVLTGKALFLLGRQGIINTSQLGNRTTQTPATYKIKSSS